MILYIRDDEGVLWRLRGDHLKVVEDDTPEAGFEFPVRHPGDKSSAEQALMFLNKTGYITREGAVTESERFAKPSVGEDRRAGSTPVPPAKRVDVESPSRNTPANPDLLNPDDPETGAIFGAIETVLRDYIRVASLIPGWTATDTDRTKRLAEMCNAAARSIMSPLTVEDVKDFCFPAWTSNGTMMVRREYLSDTHPESVPALFQKQYVVSIYVVLGQHWRELFGDDEPQETT